MPLPGIGRHPGALSRPQADGLSTPASASSRWCGRTCKPSDILTRDAFENAIVVNSAIGGSTNAPIHLNAIARHIGVELDNRRLADDRPRHPAAGQSAAGRRISGRGYHRAGGVPAVVAELMTPRPDPRERHHRQRQDASARTAARAADRGPRGHPPLRRAAEGTMPASSVCAAICSIRAIMKTSVISPEFRERYLSNPKDPECLRRQGHRVRRAGGLSRPHRRSGARHRRAHACCSCAASGRSAIPARPRS